MQNYQKNARILNIHFVFMFDHFKMGEKWHMCIWNPFEFKFGVELQALLQCTSFKWNVNTLAPCTSHYTIDHEIEHCTFF